jgi:4a-hydroxytetrahydrobiopterin dehydratase
MKILITEKQYKNLKSEWKQINNKLVKTYKFKNYDDVMKFVNNVSQIAKKQNHHPDMLVKYDSVKLTMFDHEANDITDKCYKFTNAVDKINL